MDLNSRIIISTKNMAILNEIIARLQKEFGDEFMVTSSSIPNTKEPFINGVHVFASLSIKEDGDK